MLKLNDIVSSVYHRLSVDEDNTTYDKNKRVIPKINSVLKRILADRKYDILVDNSPYWPFIKGGDINFLRDNFFFERVDEFMIKEMASLGESEIKIRYKKWMPNKWAVYVHWMILRYKLDNQNWEYSILLDEPLQMSVKPWDSVEFLYEIPARAEETYQLFCIADNKEFEVVYADYRYPNDYPAYWTILFKDDRKYIRLNLPYQYNTQRFKLNFFKKIMDLKGGDELSPMPENRWDEDVVANLVAGELLWETEHTEDAARKLAEWYGNLILFYDKFAETNKGFRQDLWWNRNLHNNRPII